MGVHLQLDFQVLAFQVQDAPGVDSGVEDGCARDGDGQFEPLVVLETGSGQQVLVQDPADGVAQTPAFQFRGPGGVGLYSGDEGGG